MANNKQEFEKVFGEAIKTAGEVLKLARQGKLDDNELGVGRIACAIISAWTRLQQTESARQATTFVMARELAENTDQLKEYLRVSLPPASPMVKMLTK